VLNVIHSRSALPDASKRALWEGEREKWLRTIGDVLRETTSFDVTLDRVVVAPAGILVAATESQEMIDVRKRLVTALDLGIEVPELCHVTLTRFGPTVPDITTVQHAVRSLDLQVVSHISELRTVRETVYPSLERETLCQHTL
jgi:hypothetical protein